MTRADKIRESRRLKALGWTAVEIGRYLGVSDSTIRNWYLGGDCVDCGTPVTYDSASWPTIIRCAPCSKRPLAEHGTRNRYNSGCSCDDCRRANREYQRSLRGKTPPNHGHSGYVNYGCRCPVCRDGHLVYMRSHNYEHQRTYAAKMKAAPTPDDVHGTVKGYKVYACRCDLCRAANAAYYRDYKRRKAAERMPERIAA